ncbi:chemotaxis protein CheB [Rhodohalobacter sp. 8-1]|uniref:chemotaxis protein CheB n=1 Tax=Rhodohalobacter sp. 8-1 TaxID=3131972 RepID=UPI0030EE8DAF
MEKQTNPITVFIIDQNVLMRRVLANILHKERRVFISYSSDKANYGTVISRMENKKPALLFLGVDELDSNEMTLFYKLRDRHPDLPIVLMTQLNKKGAAVAIEGLKYGAIDYVTKPENSFGLLFAERHFHKRVMPLLKTISGLNHKYRVDGEKDKTERAVSKESFPNVGLMAPDNIDLITIGGCLGGVSSLYKVISSLPKHLHVPVVIVQHMPGVYTKEFAADLNKQSDLTVKEASNGCLPAPGNVYIAPGGFHTVIKNDKGRKQLVLHKGPREHKCRPSIDVLYRSAVQEYGGNVLGILLSGMGNDGVLGALAVLEHGGTLLLESKESALVSELPRKVKIFNSEIKEMAAEFMPQEIADLLKQLSLQNVSDYKNAQVSINPDYRTMSEPGVGMTM